MVCELSISLGKLCYSYILYQSIIEYTGSLNAQASPFISGNGRFYLKLTFIYSLDTL